MAHAVPAEEPVIRVVAMPADTNPHGDIFGGWLMSLMDIGAGTVACQRLGAAEIISEIRPISV